MNNLIIFYKNLYSHFGPQNWWPVTIEGDESPKYHKNIKLTEKQRLEICFGAILTQSTSWKNAEKAIIELNKKNLIDAYKVLKIKKQKLAQIIKSSGYNNQKAKKLKNFCQFLSKKYEGRLQKFFQSGIAKLRQELLSVNGIGPETADSIILYAAKKPIFVVDAYTRRIFSRMGFMEEDYDGLQSLFHENLPESEKLFNEYHALIVKLGKSTCKKVPLCMKCPLKRHCSHGKKEVEIKKWSYR